VVSWVCEAAAEAAHMHHIQVALILSMNRHESVEIAEQVVQAAVTFRDQGVVGIDLAGQESNFAASPFAAVFARAKADGLFVTAHAGEWAGPESVREVIEALHADRIGHGVRAQEDPAVVKLLIDRGVALEVCPTSNVDSGSVPAYVTHPIRRLYDAGVSTTLNTDDPLISNITLSDEYAAAMRLLNFTPDDIRRHILNGAEAAFLSAAGRAGLVTRFQQWFDEMAETPAS
jgi:adenosine deaminase